MNPEELANRLGLRRRARSWGGGACPACGYPRVCTVKAAPGGRARIYCANGCSPDQLRDAVQGIVGPDWQPAPAPAAEDVAAARAGKQAAALRLWNGSAPARGTLADRYLAGRHLPDLAASAALRFRADCRHPEGGALPAMVALIQDVHGAPLAAHRTFLGSDGGKAAVDPPRASLGPFWGGAVRLDPCEDELVIGEGIETSAAAGVLFGMPAWAAISAGNLGRGVQLPDQVRTVVIAADRDPPARNGVRPGQNAAHDAAARWRAEGRTVRIAIPKAEGQDFADLLAREVAGRG